MPICNLLTHSDGLTKILRVCCGIFLHHGKGVPTDFAPQLHKNDGKYFEMGVTWGIHSSGNENYSLVGYDVVQFGRLTLMFPKNKPPPNLKYRRRWQHDIRIAATDLPNCTTSQLSRRSFSLQAEFVLGTQQTHGNVLRFGYSRRK